MLMLQRAITEDDPGGRPLGTPWEETTRNPARHCMQAALREWAEEIGVPAPKGALTGSWDAANGIYRGFVITVPSEDSVDIFGDRDAVWDPDDPKGDHSQACAWFDPGQFADNPSMRDEMAADLPAVLAALGSNAEKSAETPALEATPDILGPHSLWHTPDRHVQTRQKLPNYVEHIAHALYARPGAWTSPQAIATAINAVKRWARGDLHWGHGKRHARGAEAASQRALTSEWEALRASHH